MNIIVRTAEKSDIDTLIKFRFFYQTDIAGKLTDEQTEKLNAQLPAYFEKHIGNDLTAYLAEVDGKVAATIFMVRLEKPASVHFLSGKTCYLMNVYTVKEYRCMGIASMLLDRLIADARAEEITCIDLSATEMGKPLYLKKGFIERGNTEMRMKL
ncbi:MAG: GNAT family N-acetyltransferase [Oscillospiraceae bacterium]|nr:GNAT family N-acetyltransferase [Oscillospiraceae bacterium]